MNEAVAPEPGDARLFELGARRIAVPVPFPDAGGPVNVYLIENAPAEGGWTLFDTGVRSEESEAALRKGLADHGVPVTALKRIIVSHGHVDHFGQAQLLSEESGAKVLVHAGDWEKVVGGGRWIEDAPRYAAYFASLGVPAEHIETMVKIGHATFKYARAVEAGRAERLEAGRRFEFAKFGCEVLHLPGHTPGLVCLWDAKDRVLFADDHVLARVSPNPLLELTADGSRTVEALRTYLSSARRVHGMEIDWVLPGHGAPFQGHRELLEGLFKFYEKRQEKLIERLREGEATAFELIVTLFRRVDVPRLFLTLSEVVGNLEVLEHSGRVARRAENGVLRFALA